MVVVNDGTEGACSTTLMEYQSDGYCAGDAGTAECAGLALSYSPMYSAVIPGNVEQTFTVPVIVGNISAEDGVVFSSSSPSVTITPDPSTGGVLLTIGPTATAAPVTITATHDGDCGSASLHISVGTEAEWSAGSAIWNAPTSPDGGSPGCASCHSRSGSGGGFSDVTATPEQTAGFSDSQLLGIIENGQVPDGGYFDTTLITAAEFSRIHQFALSASDATGVVLYLRSLTPTPQMGSVSLEP
jgi:hypothetical protein